MVKFLLRSITIINLLLWSMSCNAGSTVGNVYQDGIILTINNNVFDPKKHKIDYCSRKKPCAIDGKIFYGGRGKIPKTEIKSLVFQKDGRKIYLDTSSMYNSGVTNSNIKKYISIERYHSKTSYRIVGYFGGDIKNDMEPYIAHWLVRPDGSVRNHLSDYESLVSLLFKVNKDFNIQE